MKNILILASCIIIISCNSKKEDSVAVDSISTDTTSGVAGTPTSVSHNPDTKLFIWRATPDYEKERNRSVSTNSLPVDSLIKGLNEYYENVKLEKTNQTGDTLFTIIKDSEFLTQRMGSTGAEMYIADVVLNLTTVPGIRFVKVDFEEGDHAGPGVWTAENFKSFKEKKP